MVHLNRVEILKDQEKFSLLKKVGFEKIDDIPDSIDEIKKNPIAKPILEWRKQREILKHNFLENLNYLKSILDEYNSLLEIDYNQNMDIVKVANRLIEINDRMIVCLNETDEIDVKTLVEVYDIVSKEKK